jgi:chemotaxis protein methyltransferase CheR
MSVIPINDMEFQVVQKVLFKESGITLSDTKKMMVQSRLDKRLKNLNIKSYADYLKVVQISMDERTEFVNELTTNETYFFRESKHFDFLKILAKSSKKLRIWSAAASIGAEAYSIGMVLDTYVQGGEWEVVASDINTATLEIARRRLYPFVWSGKIPQQYQKKYCLRGTDKYKDKLLIDSRISQQVEFVENNLLQANPKLGQFDVVFLRNVLLYFTDETKIRVIRNVLENLKTGGFLIISLTEHFDHQKIDDLEYLHSAIYQKI